MNKLWVFGDSYSDSFISPNKNDKFRQDYSKWKGYSPKVYGEILAERNNMEYVNKARGGWDNISIFEEFCKSANDIKDGDYIIFGWSDPVRFRLANYEFTNWANYLPSNYDNLIENISKQTIEEILINRNHKLYKNELFNWINLINFSLKNCKVIHWTWCGNLSKLADWSNGSTLTNGCIDTITTETKGVMHDSHYSESGHLILANLLEKVPDKNTLKK